MPIICIKKRYISSQLIIEEKYNLKKIQNHLTFFKENFCLFDTILIDLIPEVRNLYLQFLLHIWYFELVAAAAEEWSKNRKSNLPILYIPKNFKQRFLNLLISPYISKWLKWTLRIIWYFNICKAIICVDASYLKAIPCIASKLPPFRNIFIHSTLCPLCQRIFRFWYSACKHNFAHWSASH